MLKKLLIGVLALITLAFVALQIYINTGDVVELPPETNQIVNQLLEEGNLPELITGKTGFAQNGEVKIWYEIIAPADTIKATVLLVMGHSTSSLTWTPLFYQPFLDSGYQVIRYDNRGLGESNWMEDWTTENAYSLEDMAEDAVAILDAVGVEKAHIIGASMGGMIAQRLAISHGERVLSLTSIMSSGYWEDPSISSPDAISSKGSKLVLKYGIFNPSDANTLKLRIGFPQGLKGNGDYDIDVKKIAERALYEIKKRKGFNPKVGNQHTVAISKSGSRLEELGTIEMPTLIIHGKSDPLIDFAHCEKYAPLIPHAETLFIDGMGHDMPGIYMEQYHEAILKNFAKITQP